MEEVVLAYNKLTVGNISSIFKEVENSYRKSRKETASVIIKILAETEIESNLLAVASLLKLIHSVLDGGIVEEVVRRVPNLNLWCYIYNYGLVDDSFINSKVEELICSRDSLSVLRILQMCSTLLDTSTLDLIESRMEEDGSVLVKFIKESIGMIRKGNSPYRNYLQNEMASVKETLSTILSKYSKTNNEVITKATDTKEIIATKFGMNTSLKKKIFDIFTSSEDYVEAQRSFYKQVIRKVCHIEEVIRVGVDLCIAESRYNPYYFSLIVSLHNTSSVKHKSTVVKYIYRALDEKVENLSKLSIKEIYNLGMGMSDLYSSGINPLKSLVETGVFLKREEVLARVVIRSIVKLYIDKKIKKFRKMKENSSFREFYKKRMIDGSFLKEEERGSLDDLYREMFIQI